MSGVIDKNKFEDYTLINYGVLKKIGKVIKIKPLVVSQNEPLYRICRYIDNFSFVTISVSDDEKNIVATLTETDFLKILEKYNSTTAFKYVLKMQKKL